MLTSPKKPSNNSKQYPHVFSNLNTNIGHTKLVEMDWVKQEIETLEHAGVISHSVSPGASPIVVVLKKSAPGAPPCHRKGVDCRKLNALQPETQRVDINQRPETKATPLTLHKLPKIDDIFTRLGGVRIFSTLDLWSSYYHIALTLESRQKMAFIMPFEKWEFFTCPFGLVQAPAVFSLLVSKVLQGLDFAIGYLDNIIIFWKNEEERLQHIETIFCRLPDAGLKLKLSKKHIHYLGHLISAEDVQPLPEKLDSIKNMPRPTNAKEIKQFLGLTGYYRKFVPQFADIAQPLTHPTKHDVEFIWTDWCEAAFKLLQELLCDQPIRVYPDPNKPYILYTDASKYVWAGILTQTHYIIINRQNIMEDLPVAYLSRLMRRRQLNCAALTKEAFAIYVSVETPLMAKATVVNIASTTPERLPGLGEPADPCDLETPIKMKVVDQEPVLPKGAFTQDSSLQTRNPICTELPENVEVLKELQAADPRCAKILKDIKNCKIADQKYSQFDVYQLKDGVLHATVVYNMERHDTVKLPSSLVEPVLTLAHDHSGHNGFQQICLRL